MISEASALPPSGGVAFGDVPGDRVDAGAGVPLHWQPGVLLEALLSPAAGEPGPAGLVAPVERGRSGRGLAVGEEQRAAGPAGDEPGQQLGGARLDEVLAFPASPDQVGAAAA
ncbi:MULTISPECIES: hypothetical protein [unclassified Streptomyces]|uniref:hypothetical protein n=1 Tax=unclassified Streptomyces TaxID=2593676 RepID=UPI0035E0CC3D